MSWQRILETARSNGFPVIVTDVAGREPMVVMPLDTFETLAASSNGQEGEPLPYFSEEPRQEPIREAPSESESSGAFPPATEPPAASSEASVSPPASFEEAALTMEERFFLEPLEDDQENLG